MNITKRYSFLLVLCLCFPQTTRPLSSLLPLSQTAKYVLAGAAAFGLVSVIAYLNGEESAADLYKDFKCAQQENNAYQPFFNDVADLLQIKNGQWHLGCESASRLDEQKSRAFGVLLKKHHIACKKTLERLERGWKDVACRASRRTRELLDQQSKELGALSYCHNCVSLVSSLNCSITSLTQSAHACAIVAACWSAYDRYQECQAAAQVILDAYEQETKILFADQNDVARIENLKKYIAATYPSAPYPYVIYMDKVQDARSANAVRLTTYTADAFPVLHTQLSVLSGIFDKINYLLASDRDYNRQRADKIAADERKAQWEREEREARERERQRQNQYYYWHVYHHPCCDMCHCNYWYCNHWHDNYWEKQRIERDRVRVEQARLEEEQRHNREMERQREHAAREQQAFSQKVIHAATTAVHPAKPAKPFAPKSSAAFPEYDSTSHYQPDLY